MAGEGLAGLGPLEAEFHRLTGHLLPERRPNLLEERVARRDQAFGLLALWCFDHPSHLGPLRYWAGAWAGREPGPRTWELQGYLDYLAVDWGGAARAFMRSVEAEPENLDAWVDLAFALKHLGLDLGEAILFDHDEWMGLQGERGGPVTLASLARLGAELGARGPAGSGWVRPFLEAAATPG